MKKDSYPLPRIQEVLDSLVGAGHFSCLDLKSRFWQIKINESSKQYTAVTVGNLGFFECDCMCFGLSNVPATFHWLMQNCLMELKLIYCLIYLDSIAFFSHTAKHFHWLHIIFDQFREHNLKLKPLECNFFREVITYLAHQVSKDGVWPSNSNLKAIAECTLPQTYTEVCAFLGLVGYYRGFIKGLAQSHNEHLAKEGASKKSEWVLLSEDALKAFEALKHVCMTAPVLTFADYTKPFLLETDVSKDRLGAVLLQKQADGWYHPVTYGSRGPTPHEKNYHLTKLELLALKWVVTEHFKEYLPYQSFLVKTDNNPLTYIMMTPNLDATSHWWVGALVWFNFELEHQKGCDDTDGRCLKLSYHLTGPRHCEINPWWSSIGISTLGWSSQPHHSWGRMSLRGEGMCFCKPHTCTNACYGLASSPGRGPNVECSIRLAKTQKKTDLKTLMAEHVSSEEGQLILQNWQNFTINQGALYLCSMPKGDTKDLLLFIVPKAHCVTTLNGYHRDADHQGHDCTLSLLWEWFRWLGIVNQIQQSIKSCTCCLQH